MIVYKHHKPIVRSSAVTGTFFPENPPCSLAMNIKCYLPVQKNFLKKQGRMYQSHGHSIAKDRKERGGAWRPVKEGILGEDPPSRIKAGPLDVTWDTWASPITKICYLSHSAALSSDFVLRVWSTQVYTWGVCFTTISSLRTRDWLVITLHSSEAANDAQTVVGEWTCCASHCLGEGSFRCWIQVDPNEKQRKGAEKTVWLWEIRTEKVTDGTLRNSARQRICKN